MPKYFRAVAMATVSVAAMTAAGLTPQAHADDGSKKCESDGICYLVVGPSDTAVRNWLLNDVCPRDGATCEIQTDGVEDGYAPAVSLADAASGFSVLNNCGSETAEQRVTWAYRSSTSTSVEIGGGASVGIEGLFQASIETKYGTRVEDTKEVGETDVLKAPPGKQSWFELKPAVKTYTGTLKIDTGVDTYFEIPGIKASFPSPDHGSILTVREAPAQCATGAAVNPKQLKGVDEGTEVSSRTVGSS
ncbi:hypothetical protein EES43_27645 [Streptomyces sp. ADI96-02]|uniref:hypothetical protein n=1 Tax=unclassified Streptomyces TaxID=2593676 RepID=UPI000FB7DD33|nr:hypothetical protein [Streptomyces sp. ADI96-02]RPK54843.1 hypothetical protein EES43_27645 [Streptomyces sp. ADI96-02]